MGVLLKSGLASRTTRDQPECWYLGRRLARLFGINRDEKKALEDDGSSPKANGKHAKSQV
jgi:hypothetical protein